METVFEASRHRRHTQNERVKENAVQHPHHLPIPESLKEELPTRKKFASYVVKPNNIRFETQEKEEKIILLLRQHMITNIGWITMSLGLFFLPVIFLFFGNGWIPFRYQLLFFTLWYLMVFAFAFERFLLWYYNVYIISDERIIDVDFMSIHHKEIAQAKVDNIQDVTFVVTGFLQSMFNYGTVYIQTAGEEREFDFVDVPHPDKVAKVLNELLLEEEKEKLEGRVS
jgi:uncharacterized membrane protein YdbT with pleckstrin-like domain